MMMKKEMTTTDTHRRFLGVERRPAARRKSGKKMHLKVCNRTPIGRNGRRSTQKTSEQANEEASGRSSHDERRLKE